MTALSLQSALVKATCPALVDLREISLCILNAQVNGHWAYQFTYTVQ